MSQETRTIYIKVRKNFIAVKDKHGTELHYNAKLISVLNYVLQQYKGAKIKLNVK